MYPIEVLLVDPVSSKALDLAIQSLNAIQTEFHFHRAGASLEENARVFRGTKQSSADMFAWLKDTYRPLAGGHRPYLILIVDQDLRTASYTNAFGDHQAEDGLAVFTTHDDGRFVADEVRYLRYYLVRYTISFVAPALKNHAETRGCFFDRKVRKKDILGSLRTGGLCDPHTQELQPFLKGGSKTALDILRQRVAEDLPYALVMKGGGVKGLALVGALEVIAERLSFDTFAGTSAGGIAAILLAAGYTPEELRREFLALEFRDFLDRGPLQSVWNVLTQWSLHSGRRIEEWVDKKVADKLGAANRVLMRDLPRRAILYACSADRVLTFDTKGERDTETVGFAARCSAAIPLFFQSPRIGDMKVFDGGMRNNFPLRVFMEANGTKPAVGLYLKAPLKKRGWYVSQLIDAATTGEEPDVVKAHARQIAVIDPSPIRTTDFDLRRVEKGFLLAAGRAAGYRYLATSLPDEAPSAGVVEAAVKKAERLRQLVAKLRRR